MIDDLSWGEVAPLVVALAIAALVVTVYGNKVF
jgi:hypothetical protein